MNQSYIVKQAILTEKTYKLMQDGVYTFLVAKKATKDEIQKVIESQFLVKVDKVNISMRPAKTRRIARSRKTIKTSVGKKALVFLASGQKIEMLSPATKKESKSQIGKELAQTKKKKGLLSRIKKSKYDQF